MRHSRSYPNVIMRWYRPVEHECLSCHRTLREAVAVSRRTVITLAGVIKLNHAGYRCPDPQCVGHQRTYRSVEADALALPHAHVWTRHCAAGGTTAPLGTPDGR